MKVDRVIWDLDDDPDGNVQHIADHGLTIEEVEEVLRAAGRKDIFVSRSSGSPITFGYTSTHKHLAVVFDVVEENPLAVRPITAYETEA